MGLKNENFEVRFQKQPAKLLSTKLVAPRRVLVLLDRSGSMERAGTEEDAIAEHLVRSLPQDGRVALVGFSEKVHLISGFGTPADEAIRRLEALPPPKGRTSLVEAMLTALRSASPIYPGDTMVVIGDGGDNGSYVRLERSFRVLSASGLRIVQVVLNDNISTTAEVIGPNYLQRLADETGGVLFSLEQDGGRDKARRSERIADSIIAWLNSGYDLELQLPSTARKLEKLELKIVNLPAGVHPKHISYSRWVLPCDDPASSTQPR